MLLINYHARFCLSRRRGEQGFPGEKGWHQHPCGNVPSPRFQGAGSPQHPSPMPGTRSCTAFPPTETSPVSGDTRDELVTGSSRPGPHRRRLLQEEWLLCPIMGPGGLRGTTGTWRRVCGAPAGPAAVVSPAAGQSPGWEEVTFTLQSLGGSRRAVGQGGQSSGAVGQHLLQGCWVRRWRPTAGTSPSKPVGLP